MARSFWGWGVDEARPTPEQAAGMARTLEQRFGRALEAPRPLPRAARPRAARAARRRSERAARAAARRPDRSRRPPLRQVVPRRRARAARRLPAARPTSSRIPRARPTSSRCSTGAATPRIAAIPYGGGSSVVGGVECDVGDALPRRRLASTSARSTACSRSTATRARRASRPARSAPRSRSSCARTA